MGSPSTFSNNSNLPQIPGGARQIPQSYLNHIGREIDKARQSPSSGQVSMQTPGGSNIDISTMLEQLVAGFYRPLPFEVGLVSVGGAGLNVTIAEGRIFGRTNWTDGVKPPTIEGAEVTIGASGFNPSYSGPFSDAASSKPDPVDNPKSGSNTSTKGSGSSGSVTNGVDPSTRSDRNRVPNTNLPNGGKGSYYANNSKYKSGNAGSVTGNNKASYFSGQPAGNAATIIKGSTRSTDGVMHSKMTHNPLTIYK